MFTVKKKELSQTEKRLAELKEDLKECKLQMKRAEFVFSCATDEHLIEASIYEMKSLAKHYDYIICSIKNILQADKENESMGEFV